MKHIFIAFCLCIFATTVHAETTNQSHCDIAQANDKLDGVTNSECVCIYDQSDTYLTTDMKSVIKESQLAGVSPMGGLMALADVQTIGPKMESFGMAIQEKCGVS